MPQIIHCQKLGIYVEGLDSPPYPRNIGQRIYEHISKEAWNRWLAHQRC